MLQIKRVVKVFRLGSDFYLTEKACDEAFSEGLKFADLNDLPYPYKKEKTCALVTDDDTFFLLGEAIVPKA